jgi:succinyl-diaminopimelate desuccinylase
MEAEELARALIGFNTEVPPGNEEPCARYLRDHIEDLGIDGCVSDLQVFERGRANLIVKIGPDDPGLLTSGHIDVVPAGNAENWSSPAFEGRMSGGRLYGRGAADMKAGVAALVKALESVKSGKKLKRRLVFVATAGEEVGYDGMKKLMSEERVTPRDARYAVVAEPTEMRVIRGHRGGITLKVTFQGRSAHASRPEFGINAIENCSQLIQGLSSVRKEFGALTHPDLGSTIITPTVVGGGTKSNVVPESCVLTIDSRTIPQHRNESILMAVRSLVARLHRVDPDFRAKVEVMYPSHYLLVPKEDSFVKLVEEVSGSRSTIAPYGTEAPFYQKLGMTSIVFGPGSVKQAHIADEYVSVRDVRRATRIYETLIRKICT